MCRRINQKIRSFEIRARVFKQEEDLQNLVNNQIIASYLRLSQGLIWKPVKMKVG